MRNIAIVEDENKAATLLKGYIEEFAEKNNQKFQIDRFTNGIDFLDNYSPDAIVLGLSAYYALAHGMFEEFKELHERYVSKAESLKDLKIFELPSRRWE